jgi:hypothetical protein
MHGWFGRLMGKYSEEAFFEGDQSVLNPMRYIPTPFHTKLAQQRTALSQYVQQEAVGTRMRRWNRPIHDFLMPYVRGAIARVTGADAIPAEVEHKRDLDTMADELSYLRDLRQAEEAPEIFRSTPGAFPAGHINNPRARGPAPGFAAFKVPTTPARSMFRLTPRPELHSSTTATLD